MLVTVTPGVQVHESECIQSNSVIIDGPNGVLLVDAGLTTDELVSIAGELDASGRAVVAGFSTHAHWDHVLWHPSLGNAPRYTTARSAVALRDLLTQEDWREQVAEGLPTEIAGDVPMESLGLVTGLPEGTTAIPWGGPGIRILEHRAHTAGHAALVVEERRVLVAGDMLSDVLVPMLDLHGSDDPIGDYLRALDLFESTVQVVDFVIPGHGSVGDANDLRARIDLDRAYVLALRDGGEVSDPRIGASAKPGWEWVAGIHAWQAGSLAPGT